MINTQFNYNTASFGGAIYIRQKVQLLITNCLLNENTADNKGGAIRGRDDVTLEISNTKLNNNKASTDGGAINVYLSSQLLIINCYHGWKYCTWQRWCYMGRFYHNIEH